MSRDDKTQKRRVAVIGGGISGIAAAYYLRQRGYEPEILEMGSELGGRIGACEMNGRHVELGGKNIGRKYRLFREFAASLGDFRYEHIGVNTARIENGRLQTLDSSRKWSYVSEIARRSPRDIARFLRMILKIRFDAREGYLGGAWFDGLAGRTGDPVASEYFTRAFCQNTLRAMSLLMNAAEPDEIHVGNLGSNVRMALDDYDQLAVGMGDLLRAFASRGGVRLGTKVLALRVHGGRLTDLRIEGPAGQREDRAYGAVVVATPANVTSELLAPHAPALARELGAVRYFPTAVVVAEYERDVFTPAVRALRFEEGNPLSSARAYGKTTLNVVRYTFSGRAARPFLEGAIDGEALLQRGEASLGAHFPVSRAARRAFVAPPRAFTLCAYSQHHGARLDRIAAAVRGLPGVHLAGDYLRGASLEACFQASRECVDALARLEGERVVEAPPPSAAASHEHP